MDPIFVYVKIPESIGPMDRGDKYEDPLDECLARSALGEISGGGTQLGDERPDGTRPIEFCGIDVDVTDLPKALALLRSELKSLGAPDGTEIHYTVDGVQLQDELRCGDWKLAQLRTLFRPGFGC